MKALGPVSRCWGGEATPTAALLTDLSLVKLVSTNFLWFRLQQNERNWNPHLSGFVQFFFGERLNLSFVILSS